MSAAVVVGIGVLGGLGAVGRLLLDGAIAGRLGRDFPYGTLVVNLSGALALGLLAGAALTGDAYRLAATGLLGAYTTFSTWMFESQRLAEDGRAGLGALNIGASIVLGVAAVWIGRRIGAAL
jgi:CrcB protein